MLKTSLVGVPWVRSLELLGVEVKNKPGSLMKMKLAELISVATRRDWGSL